MESEAAINFSAPDAMPAQQSSHSPSTALIWALIIPGAGQAYNGQPFKGAFLVMGSVLVLPWFISLIDAPKVARSLHQEGARFGASRSIWMLFHFWFLS